MNKISIVIIEDNDLTRLTFATYFKKCLPLEFLGEAANGMEGLKLIQTIQPDIAIVDIGLPELDGIALTQLIKESGCNTKILILTLLDRPQEVIAAFAAGADSYCLKDINFDLLLDAIEETHKGNAWIAPAIAKIVLTNLDSQTKTNPQNVFSPKREKKPIEVQEKIAIDKNFCYLTDREYEILRLIVDGKTNSQISEILFIAVGTVKTHVRNILNKLSADDRTQAAVLAIRRGLI
jgi:DNA-binding NarL/FixJ family response regulator